MRKIAVKLGCLVCVLLSQGCRKEQNLSPVRVPLPVGLRKLALFRNGTYWIYRNTQTGELDSQYVDAFLIDTLRIYNPDAPAEPPLALEERFQYRVTSALTQQQWRYASGVYCVGYAYDTTNVCHNVSRRLVLNNADGGYADFLFYKPIVGTTYTANAYSVATLAAIHDTLRVGGISYRRVIEVNTVNDNSELPLGNTRYFIAPEAGLVRRELQHSGRLDRWDVVRKHIVQ